MGYEILPIVAGFMGVLHAAIIGTNWGMRKSLFGPKMMGETLASLVISFSCFFMAPFGFQSGPVSLTIVPFSLLGALVATGSIVFLTGVLIRFAQKPSEGDNSRG